MSGSTQKREKDPWEPTRRFFEELQKLRDADPNPKLYTFKPGAVRREV